MNKKKYPQRTNEHITETKSLRILLNVLPDDWLFRETTGQDYGIDGFIEICDFTDMQGKLLAVQLKGSQDIKANKRGYLTKGNIKKSTFSYWENYNIPIVLFYIDIEKEDVFYCNIKEYLRDNYEIYQKGELKKIILNPKNEIKKENARSVLEQIFNQEININNFESTIIDFVSNLRDIEKMFQEYKGKNDEDGPNLADSISYRFLTQSYRRHKLVQFFSIQNYNESISFQYIKKSYEESKETCFICSKYMDKYQEKTKATSEMLLKKIMEYIFSQKRFFYWNEKYPMLILLLKNYE